MSSTFAQIMYNLLKLCNQQHEHKQAWYQTKQTLVNHVPAGDTSGIPEKSAAVDAHFRPLQGWASSAKGAEGTG